MHYPMMTPYRGYGQAATPAPATTTQISPAALRAFSPALARAMTAQMQQQQAQQGFPTWGYIAIGVAAVGAGWFFFLRKKPAAA